MGIFCCTWAYSTKSLATFGLYQSIKSDPIRLMSYECCKALPKTENYRIGLNFRWVKISCFVFLNSRLNFVVIFNNILVNKHVQQSKYIHLPGLIFVIIFKIAIIAKIKTLPKNKQQELLKRGPFAKGQPVFEYEPFFSVKM